MDYKVYYTLRDDEDLDYKADLYTEQDKPEGAQLIEFKADGDEAAKAHVLDNIGENGDKRPLRGYGKLKSCRPKGKSGNMRSPILLDMTQVKDPLKASMLAALQPLITSGDLVNEDGKVRPKDRDMLIIKERKKKEKVEGEETTAPTDGQPADAPVGLDSMDVQPGGEPGQIVPVEQQQPVEEPQSKTA